MKKLYVIVSYENRTNEQITQARESIKARMEEAMDEQFELLLPTPGLKRVSGEIDALFNADYIIYEKNALYSTPCRVIHEVAVSYNSNTFDEN